MAPSAFDFANLTPHSVRKGIMHNTQLNTHTLQSAAAQQHAVSGEPQAASSASNLGVQALLLHQDNCCPHAILAHNLCSQFTLCNFPGQMTWTDENAVGSP